ncbi:MAG: HigA family addiction module antitoxin [Chthoniobacteraceae bacterium]
MDETFESPARALEAWLQEKGVTAYQLSKDTALPQSRISEILAGRRRITPETATHFGSYFGNSAEYWMGIQTKYDLSESNKAGAEHQVSWGELKLGSWACHAYVLSDERRIISAVNVAKLFGFKGSIPSVGTSLGNLIDSPYLKSPMMAELRTRVAKPIKFINHEKIVSDGYEGETIVEFCKALLEVRRIGGLPVWAKAHADTAEMIVISLAKVGIIALIDEATGYQARRHKDALQETVRRLPDEGIRIMGKKVSR